MSAQYIRIVNSRGTEFSRSIHKVLKIPDDDGDDDGGHDDGGDDDGGHDDGGDDDRGGDDDGGDGGDDDDDDDERGPGQAHIGMIIEVVNAEPDEEDDDDEEMEPPDCFANGQMNHELFEDPDYYDDRGGS